MSKHKQNFKIFALFLLLLGIVAFPMLLITYQDQHLQNEIHLYSVESHSDKENTASQYSVWDKLQILKSAVIISQTKYNAITEYAYSTKDLISAVEEELKHLQTFQAISELEFSEVLQSSFLRKTYINNSVSSNLALNIWEIYIEYPDFGVLVYMDEETHVLYAVSVYSTNGGFPSQDALSQDGFLQYLEKKSTVQPDSEEVFEVTSTYTATEMSLSLFSYNKTTGQVTFYDFKTFDSF